MSDSIKNDSQEQNIFTQEESVKELFHQNEIRANKLVSLTMLLISVGLLLSWILDMVGVFLIDKTLFSGLPKNFAIHCAC